MQLFLLIQLLESKILLLKVIRAPNPPSTQYLGGKYYTVGDVERSYGCSPHVYLSLLGDPHKG